MSFLVQDFIDFAQIKAGKFRKNIRQFNIREAIDQVMSIQKLNAKENGIRLYASYENIKERDNGLDNDLIRKSNQLKQYSPLIYGDK